MQSVRFMIAVFEFVLLLFSLSFHEAAHAWTASLLGDHTARLEGRVTLNPTYHIDPIGTLLIPALAVFGPFIGFGFLGGVLIGWAKPTPVITRNFKKIIRDENIVTLAGPVSNLILVFAAMAILAGMALIMPHGRTIVLAAFLAPFSPALQALPNPVALLCTLAILVNLCLFFFNLLPIPPLDGSHVVRNMLPYNAVQAYDRLGGWIGILLMIVVGGFVLRLVLGPSLGLVYSFLNHL